MATIRGGEKFEAALREMAAAVSKPATLRVGFLEGATYPDGTSVAMVAAIQDFGAPAVGIPPRPFFRNMVRTKSPGWPAAIAKLLRANRYDAEKTLGQVGEGIRGQLQQSIRDTNEPPLAPATIAAKGFDKPLIETAHLINSADYEVKS